jgi:hypothetical protein
MSPAVVTTGRLEKGLSVEDVSRSLFKMWEFFLMIPLRNDKFELEEFFL